MRHLKSGRQLNRNSSHRKALFNNMSASLLTHGLIKTTLPKAKELRRIVEPLITLSKTDTLSNRRLAYKRLNSRVMVGKLFDQWGSHFKDRPGGYTRILKCGYRRGDSAPMAYIQLIEEPCEPSKKTKSPAPESLTITQKAEPVATAEVASTEESALDNQPDVSEELEKNSDISAEKTDQKKETKETKETKEES